MKTHGLSKSREYKAWKALRSRCASNNPVTFPHYKAKGITVCERWGGFANFLSDMGLAPSADHEIDRMNNDLGYSPENCQWATNTQNVRNRSISKRWIVSGVEFESLSEAASAHSVSIQTIANWCEGGRTRSGTRTSPKANCKSYKPYENITTQAGV